MKNKLKIVLIELDYKMVTKKYLLWMNTAKITNFTEQRFKKHSIVSIKKFVKSKKISRTEFLYGIYIELPNDRIHVGNIKLGPIDFLHKTAEISYFIGDFKFQNKGIATQAVIKVNYIAKKKFNLKKITASVYSNNFFSKKLLLKNKFKLEGTLKKQFLYRNKRFDKLIFGKIL
jgi:RimJ/RimL family protein N-acetyltransferase